MALARLQTPARRQRRPAKALPALLCAAAAAVAAYLCGASLSFAPGPSGRVAPHAARQTAATPYGSRIPRASRGGEASEGGFQVGDKVQAVCPDDDEKYPGVIDSTNDDGTFVVRWDDADGGPETHDVEAGSMKKIIIFKDYVVGDDVKAISEDDGRWYPGSVGAVNKDGTFQVKWDDPDGGPETSDVKPEEMKKVVVFKDYKVDDVVEASYPDDGQMYPGTVIKANADGTFQVKWEDADGGPEDSAISPKKMRYPPIPFEKLEVGQKYTGTVRTILDFGAFVDIGSTGDGLLHISRIAEERINDIHDYVEEGQEVEVWVSELRDEGKFGLTMLESRIGGGRGAPADLSAFEGIHPDEWLEGTVRRIAPFGAFVSVSRGGVTTDGLVHISQLADVFVENIEDHVSEGQEVKVRVQSVDAERGRLSLSMKESGAGGFEGGGGGGGGAPRADMSKFEGISSDQWLTGKVARTAPFGAFVTVAAEDGSEADGLVHITQIKDGFVESVEDELEEGQEVQVRIVNLDTAANKMGLSMKSAEYE